MAETRKRKDELVNSVLEVVTLNEALIRVEVVVLSNENENGNGNVVSLSLLLLPTTNVQGFKTLLKDRLGVPESEQCLSLLHGDDQHTETELLLKGALKTWARPGGKLIVSLQRIPLNPLVESLFETTFMEDWKDRDDMMYRMTLDRPPQRCYQGHELVQVDSEEDGANDWMCVKCRLNNLPRTKSNHQGQMMQLCPMVCRDCTFCMCNRCSISDVGSNAVPDPYDELLTLASNIGGKMASVGAWFGGRGHMCGYPEIRVDSEIVPSAFFEPDDRMSYRREGRSRPRVRKIQMAPGRKILCNGVRLVIKFDEEARNFLQDSGHQSAMQDAEMDSILENGATVSDVSSLREEWKKKGVVWSILSDEWSRRFPTFTTMDGHRAQPYSTTKLVYFSPEKVVYEVGVRIDDGDY